MTVLLGMPATPRNASATTSPAVDRAVDTAAAAARPTGERGLLDTFGRRATDLRISLTDRCNLRCTYCMPAEGLPTTPLPQLLQADEIARLARIAVEHLGVRQVRFTGGEPLLRKDLAEIIASCAELDPRPEISLTTNAIGLSSRAKALAAAGLDRINVSLDTVHAATFLEVTRRPFLDRVLAGIDAAAESGLQPVKINAVLLRGVNDDQAPELLQWALDRGHQLRFIEQMPLDADHAWERETMITAHEIRDRLAQRFRLEPHDEPRDGAPAELFQVFALEGAGAGDSDGPGSDDSGSLAPAALAPGSLETGSLATELLATELLKPESPLPLGLVGIIASVTEAFCGDCRRTRLTSEGRVRSCLFSHTETDLLGPLRAGATDLELAELWRDAMWAKPSGHGLDVGGFQQPDRTMSAIGG